jgi:hypothetical protein
LVWLGVVVCFCSQYTNTYNRYVRGRWKQQRVRSYAVAKLVKSHMEATRRRSLNAVSRVPPQWERVRSLLLLPLLPLLLLLLPLLPLLPLLLLLLLPRPLPALLPLLPLLLLLLLPRPLPVLLMPMLGRRSDIFGRGNAHACTDAFFAPTHTSAQSNRKLREATEALKSIVAKVKVWERLLQVSRQQRQEDQQQQPSSSSSSSSGSNNNYSNSNSSSSSSKDEQEEQQQQQRRRRRQQQQEEQQRQQQ